MTKHYIALHVKYPFFWSHFSATVIFSTDFFKNFQISSFMKIRPVGAALFHVNRQTGGPIDRQTWRR